MRREFLYELRLDNGVSKSEATEIANSVAEVRKELLSKDCKFSLPTAAMLSILLDALETQALGKAR